MATITILSERLLLFDMTEPAGILVLLYIMASTSVFIWLMLSDDRTDRAIRGLRNARRFTDAVIDKICRAGYDLLTWLFNKLTCLSFEIDRLFKSYSRASLEIARAVWASITLGQQRVLLWLFGNKKHQGAIGAAYNTANNFLKNSGRVLFYALECFRSSSLAIFHHKTTQQIALVFWQVCCNFLIILLLLCLAIGQVVKAAALDRFVQCFLLLWCVVTIGCYFFD